jgi:opacity protein-like surface antigen
MMRRLVLLVILALAVTSAALFAQAVEPLIGVWTVDVFKSTYVTGQPPVRRVITFEAAGDNLKFTQETTNQGFNISETVKVEYTAKIDGKDYPIMNSGLDTVALRKIDPTTYERLGKIKGMQTETATMKLSNRNRTLTITTKGTTDAGAEYARTEVFNRQ